MKSKYRFFIILLFISLFFYSKQANAQQCIDSLYINEYYPCPEYFEPVCACDGKTYKNDCYANNKYGVLRYERGICEPLAFDFNPNPVGGSYSYIDIIVFTKEISTVRLQIVDVYGLIWNSLVYEDIDPVYGYTDQIDVIYLPQGVYFLVVFDNSTIKVKKFLKSN